MFDCDYLIVGGGASGLSLAYHIAREPRLAGRRVLIVEPDAAKADDRAWRYWAAGDTPFAAVEAQRWARLVIRTPGFEKVLALDPYRYRMVRAGDFYAHVNAALDARPEQFTRITGRVATLVEVPGSVVVEGVTECDGGAEDRDELGVEGGAVATLEDGRRVTARYAFDSRLPHLVRDPARHRYLEQHFLGWEIETDTDEFDPETVQFMDFRVPQHGQTRFVYALPFGPRRALVEFTVFSEQVLQKAEYETELRAYLAMQLGGRPYRIVAEEGGSIPMTDHPLPARVSAHVLNLGTRAGRSKSSTGYTFARAQRHAARLVSALAATGHPPADAAGDRWQFNLFDTLLLDIMQRRGETVRDIFRQLFTRNPVQRIFRFLDEETTWAENLQVMQSVRPWPFLRSIGQVLAGRPGRRKKSGSAG